jgi:hypothetical protein
MPGGLGPLYMALASHGGRCKHGCGNQGSRQKFGFSHSISPFGFEKPTGLAPLRKWRSVRTIKGTSAHAVSTPREIDVQKPIQISKLVFN